MEDFFNNLLLIIKQVFGGAEDRIPLAEYTGWHFVVMIFIGMLAIAAIVCICVAIIWLAVAILKGIGRITVIVFSAKKRCSKIQCPHCGRTLDRCVCESNAKNGYLKRLALYSKEKKAAQKAKKNANKNKKA